MIGYIYLTTNLVNGKIYVGKHEWESGHDSKYLGSGMLLHRAINKYGKEKFSNTILEQCESYNSLNEKEIYWINKLEATNLDIGYNLTLGGTGGSNGSIHITKDDIECCILPDQLPWFEAQGWVRGRSNSCLVNLKASLQDPSKHQGMKDKHQSDYQKERTRNQRKDKGEAHRQHCREAHNGKYLIYNDVESFYIEPEELEHYVALGYTRGRRHKNKKK